MTSINTNVAAQTALRTLQSTNAQLDATQGRISTGLKISSAKDNAAYWSISTSMKSDNKALATVKDALALGSGAVDVAYQGLNSSLNVLNEIKSKLTAASNPSADRAAIQAELTQLFAQLEAFADAASFGGENWLAGEAAAGGEAPDAGETPAPDAGETPAPDAGETPAPDAGETPAPDAGETPAPDAGETPAPGGGGGEGGEPVPVASTTKNIVTGFTRDGNNVTLKSIEIDTSDFTLATLTTGVGAITISATTTEEQFQVHLGTVQEAITNVTNAAAKLGAVSSRIEMQQSFVDTLRDTIDKGISGLIDADMNEESTRLQALQVKQQLGVQALSIANQSAQNVLRLFQ